MNGMRAVSVAVTIAIFHAGSGVTVFALGLGRTRWSVRWFE